MRLVFNRAQSSFCFLYIFRVGTKQHISCRRLFFDMLWVSKIKLKRIRQQQQHCGKMKEMADEFNDIHIF